MQQPPTGDALIQKKKSIVIEFCGPRRVLSTSPYNGGCREDITAVYNFDCKDEETGYSDLRTDTYEGELRLTACDLGLDPESTTGLSTAAQMHNAAMATACFENVSVTTIATGGINVNAVRAGDPASYCERNGEFIVFQPGTINMILLFSCKLSPGILTRALVTATEAKAAAVGELMVPSRYSHGIAKGSGTDGVILSADLSANIELTDAGTHAKLGELIAQSVKKAVKEALFHQTGMCSAYQHSVMQRLEQFEISDEQLWGACCKRRGSIDRTLYREQLHKLDRDGLAVSIISMCLHLLDEANWGLLSTAEVRHAFLAVRGMNLQPMLEDILLCLEDILR